MVKNAKGLKRESFIRSILRVPMVKYVLKRLLIATLTLSVIILALFVLLHFMPGSPFNDEKMSLEQIAAANAKYGLDQPVPIQFVRYFKNMLTGDFGVSYNISKNVEITTLIDARLPVSLRLGFQAVALGTVLGLLLGILAALKHNSFWDTLCTVISVIGVSVPSYVFALGLCYFLAFLLGWFPTLYTEANPFISSVLPTISLSMFTIATIARFTRTEMLDVLGSDYMLLAESKGVYGARLVWRHAIRNALIPVITVLGPLVVDLMTGSMVVEKIFSIPGVGTLLVQAIQTNDYNVTVALAFVYSLMYVVMMLIVDVLYGVIDPRIRLTKEDG
jgi:oligopeptide transport system permease protein